MNLTNKQDKKYMKETVALPIGDIGMIFESIFEWEMLRELDFVSFNLLVSSLNLLKIKHIEKAETL